jgi:hypothetical protein
MGGWLQFGRGEVGWGRKRGRRRRNRGRECRQSQYVPSFSDGFTDGKLLSVIPSVIPPEKNPHHHAVATFKKRFSPSAIPPVFSDRIISSANISGIPNGIIPSLKISDEKISLVIPLVLSDFLVVYQKSRKVYEAAESQGC